MSSPPLRLFAQYQLTSLIYGNSTAPRPGSSLHRPLGFDEALISLLRMLTTAGGGEL